MVASVPTWSLAEFVADGLADLVTPAVKVAASLAPDQARAFAHQLGEAARYADEGEQGGQR